MMREFSIKSGQETQNLLKDSHSQDLLPYYINDLFKKTQRSMINLKVSII